MTSVTLVLVLALVVLPLCAALVLRLTLDGERAARALVLVAAACASCAAVVAVAAPPGPAAPLLAGLLRVDATARLFLGFVDLLFLGISVHVLARVRTSAALGRQMASFVPPALVFLAAANATLLANHLVLLWVALEATTLAMAPLIVRPGVASSRRASWHYLLFSSAGLALALMGLVCLGRGMADAGRDVTFLVHELSRRGGVPNDTWTELGLVLVLLGAGTKMGLAPMYSWLPEAYDEAQPVVVALLGALQFNCALVLLLRVLQAFRSGHAPLVAGVLLAMGIASMGVSTVGVIATRNLKRLLAYASINHAGVIAVGLAAGKSATYGLLLYVLSNAFIKTILFLSAGQIQARHRTKDTREISGLINDMPYSGAFLMIGTFALLGFPPFGSFVGELLIMSALVGSGKLLVFAAFCALITLTFVATGRTVFPMIWGSPRGRGGAARQTLGPALPKLAFLAALVLLGVYVPSTLDGILRQVAASLEGR